MNKARREIRNRTDVRDGRDGYGKGTGREGRRGEERGGVVQGVLWSKYIQLRSQLPN